MRGVKAIAAGLLLLAVTCGTPWALLLWGRIPGGFGWRSLLIADDGSLLLSLLTVVAALAWCGWCVAVAVELASHLRHVRAPRLRGLTVLQSMVGLLLSALLALGTRPTAATAVAPPPVVAQQIPHASPQPPTPAPTVTPVPGRHYVVQPGDDLWSIAERECGDGLLWREIVAANPTIANPDHIEPGWVLVLPARPTPASLLEPTPPASVRGAHTSADRTVLQPPMENPSVATDEEPPLVELADTAPPDALVGMVGLGMTVAGAVLTYLGHRQRQRDWTRVPGRRFVTETQPVERMRSMLTLVGDPLRPEDVDTVSRAVAGMGGPPHLQALTLEAERIVLQLDGADSVPVGFTPSDVGWSISRTSLGYLSPDPDAPLAWPALACVGETRAGALFVDLDEVGLLSLEGEHVDELRAGIITSLSRSPMPAVRLLVTAQDADLARALDFEHHVVDDAAGACELLVPPHDSVRARRCDPDLAEESRPTVVVLPHQPSLADALRVHRMGGILVAPGVPAARWSLGDHRLLTPTSSLDLSPTRAPASSRAALVGLLDASAATTTETAWWWADDVDGIAYLTPRPTSPVLIGRAAKENPVSDPPVAHHPYVRLLGPIDLIGARGTEPPRAIRQCIEYAAWLLENPGCTATHMSTALFVAEGTRRSNMSRLRSWLGSSDEGTLFLPEAYSGRIHLDPTVSSDWNTFQLCIAPGVNRVGPDSLAAALDLVRGCPLADAAPGQWCWAEELRTDMVGAIRDTALRLADVALEAGDLDLVRWAANRGLVAAPEDERLVVVKARAERQAGNTVEVERLVLRLTHHARTLGVDLADETVTALQELLERRLRARSIADA